MRYGIPNVQVGEPLPGPDEGEAIRLHPGSDPAPAVRERREMVVNKHREGRTDDD